MGADDRLFPLRAGSPTSRAGQPPLSAAAGGHSTPARCVEARRAEPSAGWHRPSRVIEATYTILSEGQPAKALGRERRSGSRLRTRLRSGKIIGADGRFIIECLIHNRSPSGCRLRLSSAFVPPPDVYLYEDQSGELFHAIVVWRKERDLGLRLAACAPTPAHRALAGRMRRKFYALGR